MKLIMLLFAIFFAILYISHSIRISVKQEGQILEPDEAEIQHAKDSSADNTQLAKASSVSVKRWIKGDFKFEWGKIYNVSLWVSKNRYVSHAGGQLSIRPWSGVNEQWDLQMYQSCFVIKARGSEQEYSITFQNGKPFLLKYVTHKGCWFINHRQGYDYLIKSYHKYLSHPENRLSITGSDKQDVEFTIWVESYIKQENAQ